jgi:hypothetical protein
MEQNDYKKREEKASQVQEKVKVKFYQKKRCDLPKYLKPNTYQLQKNSLVIL